MSKTLEALNNMDNSALIGDIEGRMSFDGYTEAQAIAYVTSDFAAELRKHAPMLDEDGDDMWDDDEILDYTTQLWSQDRKAIMESIVEEFGLGQDGGYVGLVFGADYDVMMDGAELIIWPDEASLKSDREANGAVYRRRLTKIDWEHLEEMNAVDTYEEWLAAQ